MIYDSSLASKRHRLALVTELDARGYTEYGLESTDMLLHVLKAVRKKDEAYGELLATHRFHRKWHAFTCLLLSLTGLFTLTLL